MLMFLLKHSTLMYYYGISGSQNTWNESVGICFSSLRVFYDYIWLHIISNLVVLNAPALAKVG